MYLQHLDIRIEHRELRLEVVGMSKVNRFEKNFTEVKKLKQKYIAYSFQ